MNECMHAVRERERERDELVRLPSNGCQQGWSFSEKAALTLRKNKESITVATNS
jgi:hypothetical protein